MKTTVAYLDELSFSIRLDDAEEVASILRQHGYDPDTVDMAVRAVIDDRPRRRRMTD